MKHALSITVSALIFAVVSGTAQAAPITSLPAGISTDASAAAQSTQKWIEEGGLTRRSLPQELAPHRH